MPAVLFKRLRWIFGFYMCSCFLPPRAHAYLDPGSGSMVLQFFLAGVAGIALGIKVFWRRILAFFSRSKEKPSKERGSSR